MWTTLPVGRVVSTLLLFSCVLIFRMCSQGHTFKTLDGNDPQNEAVARLETMKANSKVDPEVLLVLNGDRTQFYKGVPPLVIMADDQFFVALKYMWKDGTQAVAR